MGQDFDKTWILNQFRKHVQKSATLLCVFTVSSLSDIFRHCTIGCSYVYHERTLRLLHEMI